MQQNAPPAVGRNQTYSSELSLVALGGLEGKGALDMADAFLASILGTASRDMRAPELRQNPDTLRIPPPSGTTC